MDLHRRIESIATRDGAWVPPPAVPAASVVVSRAGAVLMLRRVETMRFAPRMHVFPGGRVEQVDHRAVDPFAACAVREAEEEVGIAVGGEVRLIDHWVTPEFESLRFDVRFFYAEVTTPGDLRTTEADSALWLTPDEALTAHARGEFALLRPTVEVLRGVRGLLAGGPIPEPIVPKLPRPRDVGGVLHWDVVDASSGLILEADVAGPGYAEVEGVAVR